MTVRQDRQTRRPPLAGGWSVRERSNVPRDSAVHYGAGMMLNDTYV